MIFFFFFFKMDFELLLTHFFVSLCNGRNISSNPGDSFSEALIFISIYSLGILSEDHSSSIDICTHLFFVCTVSILYQVSADH